MANDHESKCDCELCRLGNRITAALEARDFDAMYTVCGELWDRMSCAEMDCAVHEATLAGDWPNSRRTLVNALAAMCVSGKGNDEDEDAF